MLGANDRVRVAVAEELTRQMGRPIAHSPFEVNGFEERARYMIEIAEEALEDVDVGGDPVVLGDRTVGGGSVRGPDGTVRERADVELVEDGHEAIDVGCGALHRVDEGAGLQRLVDVGDAPGGELALGGRMVGGEPDLHLRRHG